ncbi:unnamed protein product [Ceutorhynchus assimilis]|uniref:Uncharacterized protein n=1 Tax=Ceutorhynchus assimilis TaxID=467358 RepID=A0A9N9QRD0_9CUCU|nr:unnamed protein product [Ceutorhynchus assimilis]
MINDLKTEVFDKTNYIDRLKREKQTLLDEAEYSEDRLVRENSALKQRLSQLARNSLEQVTNAPRKLASSSIQTLFQEEILLQNDSQTDPCLAGSSDEKQQALMIEIAEITNLNKQMATSIETLDNENRFLSNELEDLKEQLACLHVSHGKPSGVPSLSREQNIFLGNCKQRKKVTESSNENLTKLSEQFKASNDNLEKNLVETKNQLIEEQKSSLQLKTQLHQDILKKEEDIRTLRENESRYLREIAEQKNQNTKLENKNKELLQQTEKIQINQLNQTNQYTPENGCEISNLKATIKNLEDKIKDIDGKRKIERQAYSEDIAKYREDIAKLNQKIESLILTNTNINETAKTLRNNAKNFKNNTTGNKTNQLNSDSNEKIVEADKQIVPMLVNERKRKAQILILTGKNGYNYGKVCKKISENKYDINCQYATSNMNGDILEHHEKLSQRLDMNDFKIIFTHSENARRGKQIKEDVIKLVIESSKNTNLIFIGAPYVPDRPILNGFINKQNQDIQNCVKTRNATYIDINRVIKPFNIDNNDELDYRGKEIVINSNRCISNLTPDLKTT